VFEGRPGLCAPGAQDNAGGPSGTCCSAYDGDAAKNAKSAAPSSAAMARTARAVRKGREADALIPFLGRFLVRRKAMSLNLITSRPRSFGSRRLAHRTELCCGRRERQG